LIKNVKFSGDTHGDNWNAEMEAVQKWLINLNF
jgi:hypothetical protein